MAVSFLSQWCVCVCGGGINAEYTIINSQYLLKLKKKVSLAGGSKERSIKQIWVSSAEGAAQWFQIFLWFIQTFDPPPTTHTHTHTTGVHQVWPHFSHVTEKTSGILQVTTALLCPRVFVASCGRRPNNDGEHLWSFQNISGKDETTRGGKVLHQNGSAPKYNGFFLGRRRKNSAGFVWVGRVVVLFKQTSKQTQPTK